MKICKGRTKEQTWCEEYLSNCEKVTRVWKETNCFKCLNAAIHSKNVGTVIRDTAKDVLLIKKEKGGLL